MIYKKRNPIVIVCFILLFSCRGQYISNYDYTKKHVHQNCKKWGNFFDLTDCEKLDYLDSLWVTKEPRYSVKEECFVNMVSLMFKYQTDSMNLGVYENQYSYDSDSLYYIDSNRLRAKYGCK
jgi:hypothetical protein